VAVVLDADVLGCCATGLTEVLGVELCEGIELGLSFAGDGATVFTGAASWAFSGAGAAVAG
jgi:hypothetical protein